VVAERSRSQQLRLSEILLNSIRRINRLDYFYS
jgi:hypothetical protein